MTKKKSKKRDDYFNWNESDIVILEKPKKNKPNKKLKSIIKVITKLTKKVS